MSRHVRIATRKSDLALWQANWVKDRLESLAHTTELVLIETQGDREQDAFKLMQGQGFFTKAVQDAVLAQDADVAVHSHKDLPSAPMPGLEIAAISEREGPSRRPPRSSRSFQRRRYRFTSSTGCKGWHECRPPTSATSLSPP